MTDAPLTGREKALSLVIGLLATAAVIECAFRVWMPAPSGFNNERDVYPSNPRGYFDELRVEDGKPVYGVPMVQHPTTGERIGNPVRPDAPPRILGLGDSQGMGQGVRFEDTAFERLAVLMDERGVDARVVNRAVRGYDIAEVVDRAEKELDQAEYDLVIYWLVLDDFGLAVGARPKPAPSVSAAVRFFRHARAQWAVSQATTQAYLEAFTGASLAKGSDALGRLHEAVQAHDADLVVAVMPLLYDFEAYPFGPIHAALRTVCDDRKLACVDLLPALRTSDASSLWVHPIDHHPNETAHARIAAALVDAVQSGPWMKPQEDLKSEQ